MTQGSKTMCWDDGMRAIWLGDSGKMEIRDVRAPVCDVPVLGLGVRYVFGDLASVVLKILLVAFMRENNVAKCPLTLYE